VACWSSPHCGRRCLTHHTTDKVSYTPSRTPASGRAAREQLQRREAMAAVGLSESVWKQNPYKRSPYVTCRARLRTDLLDNRSLAMLLEIPKRLICWTLVSGQPLSISPGVELPYRRHPGQGRRRPRLRRCVCDGGRGEQRCHGNGPSDGNEHAAQYRRHRHGESPCATRPRWGQGLWPLTISRTGGSFWELA
jgi:hypothetical protein